MTHWLRFIRRQWLALSTIWLAIITILSLWPLEELPEVPGGDKLHHAIAYAALMFPAALKKPQHLRAIVLFYLTWSGVIELIQPYVNRYGEWSDLAANGTGLAIGWLVGRWLRPVPEKS
ncbi:MAG: hypothetical protein Q9M29_09140 [Mariprofundaceae bacterium]|nr:hypothetical protein [Mariprofundaceae bacterium]